MTYPELYARKGNKETIKHILRQNKDIVDTKNTDGQTPLHIATENEDVEIVRMLLEEFRADTRARDKKDMTALNVAAKKGNLEIAMTISGMSDACTAFSLSDNYIGFEGTQGVAKFLKQNKTLTNLNITGI